MLTGLPWWLLQRGSCKVQFVGREDDRAINSAAEGVCVPAHLAPPGSPQAKLLCHLHAQLSWGRVATGKKSLASTRIGPLQSCPTLCDRVAHGCQGGGFSRQAYWSVLANTGSYTLPGHCISCCPSRQLP